MDPAPVLAPTVEQDEWDADGFEIPSLKVGKTGSRSKQANGLNDTFKGTSLQKVITGTEKIYLGPHGAPPTQMKHQEVTAGGKRQRLKQKLKDIDKKGNLLGRENKVEALRDLMGGKGSIPTPRGAQAEWLDPHCHESQFERSG